MSNPLQLGVANYSKGAYITIAGKEAYYFYIIRTGRVQVRTQLNAGEPTILKSGDFFGVVSTMSHHAHIENVIALEDCSLITVMHHQYSMLIESNTPIALKIINVFSQNIRALDNSLTHLTFNSSVEVDEQHLFQVGEYYAKQNQFNLAFYAYYKYCLANPNGENFKTAQERIAKIKPYVKSANIDPDTSQFIRHYPKDTMLFAEGESGPELYIIQKGSVRITKIVNDNEVLLALLKAGDIFGEMALLEDKPRSASAIVNEDTILMAVNRANFKTMVVDQPKIIARLTSTLAERIWILNRQLKNSLIEDPVGRLYDTLLLELEKARLDFKTFKAHNFGFGINDLLDMAGMSHDRGRAALSKILGSKEISVRDGKIYASDIRLIFKSAEYFQKMDARNKKVVADKKRQQYQSLD